MSSATAFLPLLNSEADLAKVVRRVTTVLGNSFRVHRMRAPTEAEKRRRVDIIFRWFKTMRLELGWSLTRTLDTIDQPLEAELRGETWTPPTRDAFFGDAAQ